MRRKTCYRNCAHQRGHRSSPRLRTSDLVMAPVGVSRPFASEHFANWRPVLDDLQWTPDVALRLLARVDAERLAERAEQVRHRYGPLAHLGAELVGRADDTSAPDADPAQRHVECPRIVIAA